jgi:sigma-54 interacting transcriptional regulator
LEPLARIELSSGAPAEVIRLLPLVGLEPVCHGGAALRLASTGAAAPLAAPPIAMRVEFGTHRASIPTDTTGAPTTLTIALDSAPLGEHPTADLVTDSARAAVSFILSHVLGLASPFITADASLFDVICAATAVARGPSRILVVGEIGAGKKSLIKLIHAASRDPAGLVLAECAGLEADAVEAEIAPLLAQAASLNRARSRAGGAVFFNRIGELSPIAQRKLLDLLRAPVATAPDRRDAIANVRILAASIRPLAAMVAGGELLPELHDLFDATLTLSPLRARRGDLPLLAQHYLHGLDPALTLNVAALRALSAYPFPGNVLELINFVTRVAIIPPKSGTRRSAPGHSATGVIGRAEVINQLDRGSLHAVWRSRQAARLNRTLRKIAAPIVEAGDDEAGPSLLAVPTLPLPAALRLTTGTVPRLRKPRGGHHRPRA